MAISAINVAKKSSRHLGPRALASHFAGVVFDYDMFFSNPFDVLASVENDVELGINGGTTYLASQEANSSESLFWNVNSSSPSTTPVIEKIVKIKKLIIVRKVTLVDDEVIPLVNVAYSGDYDSEDEVSSVDNEMASFASWRRRMAMVYRVFLE
ncbi:hypothetical protein Tco_1137729 [Tanacetum coccineum]